MNIISSILKNFSVYLSLIPAKRLRFLTNPHVDKQLFMSSDYEQSDHSL